jgi:two-component system response regulator RegX3
LTSVPPSHVDDVVTASFGRSPGSNRSSPGSGDHFGAADESNPRTGDSRGDLVVGATRVLVIEDEEEQASEIRAGLEREGFAVTWARDGAAGLELFRVTNPDVLIVDATLPGLTGIDVCRRLREGRSNVPVIIVSDRSEEIDVVVAMEVGADDFVAKPYRMRVLVARIRAVLRRRSSHPSSTATPAQPTAVALVPEQVESGALVVDDLRLDPECHEVYVRGERVELTRQEFRLLEELLRRPGKLLLRQTLLERIWGPNFVGNGKILSTLVNRLRARIEDDPDDPLRIVTIRGLGYRYERMRQGDAPMHEASDSLGREGAAASCGSSPPS